jgi:hydrogenase maturation protease
MTKYVVLGIGNILLTDEGVGVRVVERLEQEYELPPEVEVIDGGTCGMEMLEQLEDLDGLIVVDCVRCNQPPATPVLLKGDDVPVFFRTKLSPHQVSLSDVLASLQFTDRAPKSIAIVGMQPVSMSLGMELSPEVVARVPELLAMTLTELRLLGIEAKVRA